MNMTVIVALALTLTAALQSPGESMTRLLERLTALEAQLSEIKTEAEAISKVLNAPPDGILIHVGPGGDVQAALDAVTPGGTVTLERGATYTGNYTIRKPLTLTTRDWAADPQARVSPDAAPWMATLKSPTVDPPLVQIEGAGASKVSIVGLHLIGPNNDILACGRGDRSQTTIEQQPRQVILNQLLIEGDPALGAKRAVALHCADASLTRSYIRGIRRPGQDTQAVAGYNGTGPFLIHDNYLEAASENILFGGADPNIPGLVPENITITANLLTKDLAWQTQSVNVKTALELKGARKVLFKGNIIERVWLAAQVGWAIVLTPSQYGSNPGVQIADVTIEDNLIRDVGGGINLLGFGQHADLPTARTERITIRNNWFRIDHKTWGGVGALIQMANAPAGLVIENNTVEQSGSRFLIGDKGPVTGLRMTGNIIKPSGQYGISVRTSSGSIEHYGRRWRDYFPDGVITGNAIAAFPAPANLPDNTHVSVDAATIIDGYGTGAIAGFGRRR